MTPIVFQKSLRSPSVASLTLLALPTVTAIQARADGLFLEAGSQLVGRNLLEVELVAGGHSRAVLLENTVGTAGHNCLLSGQVYLENGRVFGHFTAITCSDPAEVFTQPDGSKPLFLGEVTAVIVSADQKALGTEVAADAQKFLINKGDRFSVILLESDQLRRTVGRN